MNIYDKQNIRLPDEVIESNIQYYRNIDATNPQGGIFTAWNWASFLFTTYWLFYRRCYKYAILSWIGVYIFTGIASVICTLLEMPDMTYFISLITYICYGIFGNSLYINGIKEKIFNLQAKGLSDMEIIKKTKPSFIPPLILFLIPFVFAIMLFFFIFAGLMIAKL